MPPAACSRGSWHVVQVIFPWSRTKGSGICMLGTTPTGCESPGSMAWQSVQLAVRAVPPEASDVAGPSLGSPVRHPAIETATSPRMIEPAHAAGSTFAHVLA